MRSALAASILVLSLCAASAVVTGCSDSPRASNPDGAAAAGGGGGAGTGGAGGAAGATGAAGSTAGAGGAAGTGVAGAGGQAGEGGQAGQAGQGGQAGGGSVLAPPAPQGLAVVNSDYHSTSISLLNSSGALSIPVCVHSMTVGTGSSSISGDVVLPSQPQRGGKLVLIDRGNIALTTVDAAACTVSNQISVKGGLEIANPHDIVTVADGKAYVTRYNNNHAATDPLKAGDDVLIVDPRNGTVLGHVDVSAHRTATDGGGLADARPDRALIAGGLVAVSLNELDDAQANYGEGRVVLIDPATDAVVREIALTGRRNCEAMDYIAATKTLLVACGGTFGSSAQTAESGVAVVDLSVNPPPVMPSISGQVFGAQPVNAFWIVAAPSAVAPHRAFAGALGSFDPVVPDSVFAFDFLVGSSAPLASSDAFALGMGAATANVLLVPDAATSTPQVRVFSIAGAGTPAQTATFATDTANGLPPREIGWY
jgi:hypothetical protein